MSLSLLHAPPGRRVVASSVVGDLNLTSPASFDGVDLVVAGSLAALVGYLLATRRVGRLVVVITVVGDVELTSPTGFDGVDLVVGCVLPVGYLLAAG